jgi:hypothetical protein
MQVLTRENKRVLLLWRHSVVRPSYSDSYLEAKCAFRRALTSTGTSHDYLYLIRSVTFQDEDVPSLIQLLIITWELRTLFNRHHDLL